MSRNTTSHPKKITVLIPCYNEAGGIGAVIKNFPSERLLSFGYQLEIMVIDNNSSDKTVDILKQICDRLTLISLTAAEYISVIEAGAATVVGGAVYDALIARCALKAGADVLLTWNMRDFTRFGPELASLVRTPLEFQAEK